MSDITEKLIKLREDIVKGRGVPVVLIDALIEQQRSEPQAVTVEELTIPYLDALDRSGRECNLNVASVYVQDFLHFVMKNHPNGLCIVRERKEDEQV